MIKFVKNFIPEYQKCVLRKREVGRRGAEIVRPADGWGGEPRCIELQRQLQPDRQFTDSQRMMMIGQEEGSYHMDCTTAFSVRPPELIGFSNLLIYTKCFIWKSVSGPVELSRNLIDSPWIDGTGKQVKIRVSHLEDILQYAIGKEHMPLIGEIYRQIILPLIAERDERQEKAAVEVEYSDLFSRFEDKTAVQRNIVVYSQ
jgi:hypothetical protein